VRRDRRFILNFHGIGAPGRTVPSDELPYWISAGMFEDILDLVQGRPDVDLTFDDGNASDLSIGLPALHDRGLHAAFYPIADRIGRPGSSSAAGLRELVAAGMTIGSHGMRHRSWRGLDDAALREELVDAREIIAAAAGVRVTTAACPFGSYGRRATNRLRRLNYTTVFTSDAAAARSSAWLQPRFSVHESDDVGVIAALLDAPRSRRSDLLASLRITVKRWR
jgi:peptidoglycan/xylan/chitin deacetylase (PgdA/CDA1 family)